MEHWSEYTRFVIALTVIINPFIAVPILLSATEGLSREARRGVVRLTTASVAVVLMVSALSGEALLRLMGTSLGSFRVGGGIVLFLMALAMLQARADRVRTSPKEQQNVASQTSVAVVPLAVPLLAGPGAISTVIIAMQRSEAPYHGLAILLSILLVAALLFLILTLAEPIGRYLDEIKLNILNRIFGLLLAAIAVEVTANGLRALFPVLARG